MHVQNNAILVLTTLLALSTAAPRIDQAGDTVDVDIPPAPKQHSKDVMIVNDSRFLRDRPKYIDNVSKAGCVAIEHPGDSAAGLRPSDDIWCTIYKSWDCTMDNKKDKKQQVYIGFVAPGIRRWHESRNWWMREGMDWYPSSYECFKKGSTQSGLGGSER